MKEQLNMFGPPESLDSLPADMRFNDDAPVPCERELLWPMPHADELGPELLERLYGDIPKRTRLTMPEVCRRLRRGHTHIYDLVSAGSLDATDDRHPTATQAALTIYRYSLVRFLFNREFVEGATRACMSDADLRKCVTLADGLRDERDRCRVSRGQTRERRLA